MSGDFIDTFPPMDRQEWVNLIERELKGKSIDAVNWSLAPDWVVPPFSLADEAPSPLRAGKKAIDGWLIGECVSEKSSTAEAARQIEKAVNGKVQVLRLGKIRIPHLPPRGTDVPSVLLDGLPRDVDWCLEQNPEYPVIGGALSVTPHLRQIQNWSANWSGSRWLTIDCRCSASENQPEYLIDQLTDLLVKGHQLLGQFGNQSPDTINGQIRFCISVGNSFFLEIAKLRALRILWANLLQAWGLEAPHSIPPVEVHPAPDGLVNDQHLNMIRLTVQALSAVIGGCDLLMLPPSDVMEATGPSDAGRRVARNIQHILRMESHLDAVEDPAGGSYSVEYLTDSIIERVWDAFLSVTQGA